jgi:ligand-binding sensor domain-containing protein
MLVFPMHSGLAQEFPNIQFSYLTENEGLSNNEITCAAQDPEGFMWFGTVDGLNRYDGYRVRHFIHNPADENSLVNNCVFRIRPIGHQIWVTTREGVSCYDKNTGVFLNFRHNPADSSSLDDDQYVDIFPSEHHTSYLNTISSTYCFDSTWHLRRLPVKDVHLKDPYQRKLDSYAMIMEDSKGRVWAMKYQYLFMLDRTTMQIAKWYGPFAGTLQAMYEDSQGQFWLGSFGGGLIHLDLTTGRGTNVKLETSSDIVHSITEWRDQHGMRWLVLGTDRGIFLVNPVTLRCREYTFHLGHYPLQVQSKNMAHLVFVDRQNILWVCTEYGVCYVQPSRQHFELWNISTSSGKPGADAGDWIYSRCSIPGGFLMSHFVEPWLYVFNKDGNLLRTITHLQTRFGYRELTDSLKPYYLYNQGDSVIWFTTNQYLVRYDLRETKAEIYTPPDSISFNGLRTILPLDDHTWWIRTRNNGPNGIYVFDPVARSFVKHYSNYPGCDGCVPPQLFDMFLTSKKELYVTARGKGLLQWDRATDHFIPVFSFRGKDLERHSNSFEDITEDSRGILWIATYTGLFAWDPATKKVVQDYTANEQIGGIEISHVLLDNGQNIWLSTERGVFYILHGTGKIRRMSSVEGLTNNFTNGIFESGNDPFIYACIRGFLVRIRPSELLGTVPQAGNVDIPGQVHFSDATIMDLPSYFHYDAGGKKEMVIAPGQNRFAVDFSVMNYDGSNRYYYRLDGVTNSWQENESGHLAFYNLSPGKYKLQVRGSDQYGDLTSGEDEMTIVVRPRWWQTVWVRAFTLVLILAVAILLIRRRIKIIRKEAAFRQKISDTEMMALRAQMNPHFIFNSLNSIENFIMRNEKRLASDYLNKFARLIRMILENSRVNAVPVEKDMEALQLYVDLEQLRFNHKFDYKAAVSQALLQDNYRVPPMLIQPFVENAIVHGLANSDKSGLLLMVTVELQKDFIRYVVEDNGVGNAQAAAYKEKNRPGHQSLGLLITQERINIFNRQHNSGATLQLVDLYDDRQQPAGTRVEIKIKPV